VQVVGGSNPLAPTNLLQGFQSETLFHFLKWYDF
jgi:hypothetical protein